MKEHITQLFEVAKERLSLWRLKKLENDLAYFNRAAAENSSKEEYETRFGARWDASNTWFIDEASELAEFARELLRTRQQEFESAQASRTRSEAQHLTRQKDRIVPRTLWEVISAIIAPLSLIGIVFVSWNALTLLAVDGFVLDKFAHDAGQADAAWFVLFALIGAMVAKAWASSISDETRREQLITTLSIITLMLLGIWAGSFSLIYSANTSSGLDTEFLIDEQIVRFALVASQIIGELLAASLIWLWADRTDQLGRPVVLINTPAHKQTIQRVSETEFAVLEVKQFLAAMTSRIRAAEQHRTDTITDAMGHLQAAHLERQARVAAAKAVGLNDEHAHQ